MKQDENKRGNLRFWIKAGLIALAVIGAYLVGTLYLRQFISLADVQDYIESFGPLAPLVFIAIYAFAPLFPASAMTIASGVLFGPFWGLLYAWIGACISMTYPFWLTKYFGRKPFEKLLSRMGGFEKKIEKWECNVEKQGWKFVAFCRLMPIFSFTMLNYLFGLTRISFRSYFLTSMVFIIPGTAIYAYAGYAGREAAAGASGLYLKLSLAIVLLASLALIPRLIRLWRKDKSDSGCDIDTQE
ncbi:MAG: TVP38/TMEM64 family protein [Candidatus Obscuribacterales bacterium]|nr:TVP38/TMEM64 family protein [Candidatus Obscuribacterales bacterium]